MSSRCVFRILMALAIMLMGAIPSVGLEAAQAAPAGVGLSQEPEPTGRLSIIHAAPFAEAITDTVVSLVVDGTVQPGVVAFGDASPYMALAVGTYEFGVIPAGEMTPVVTATVVISEDQESTLAFIGDDGNQPLELMQVEDNWAVPEPGMAALRVAHLAPFAADLADTQVDVLTEDGVLVGTLENLEYGTFSEFLEMPAGIQDFVVVDPTDMVILDLPPIVLKDGDVITLFVIGGANEWAIQPMAMLNFPQDPARLRVAHLAPFADTAEATSVSVFLDGTEVASNLTYSATTEYIDVAPGMYTVAIVPTGEMTPAITGTVTLVSGIDFTAAAVGDGDLQPLELLVTMDDNLPPPLDTAKLRVVHAAPFDADPALTAVDVRDAEGEVFGGLEGLMYGDATDYLELAPDTYELTLTTPGGDTVLLELPPLALVDGEVATLYVVGDDVNQPLDVLLVVGMMRTPTSVQVANLAPFAEDPADTAITVAVEDFPIASGLTFSETTDFVDLPAGVFLISVMPEVDMTMAISGTMFLTWDAQYIAAVIGDGTNWPLDLFVLRDEPSPAMGMAGLRIVHVAPFTSTLEATAVNVVTEDGEPLDDVTGLTYKGVTEFMDVAPGVFDLNVTDPDGTVLIDIDPFRLVAGQSATVFIVGDGVNQPLGVATPGLELGTVIFLPIVFRDGQPMPQ